MSYWTEGAEQPDWKASSTAVGHVCVEQEGHCLAGHRPSVDLLRAHDGRLAVLARRRPGKCVEQEVAALPAAASTNGKGAGAREVEPSGDLFPTSLSGLRRQLCCRWGAASRQPPTEEKGNERSALI